MKKTFILFLALCGLLIQTQAQNLPVMTPAIAQTNTLSDPVVWQQYQQAQAAAATLAKSGTNQSSLLSQRTAALSSSLSTQNVTPASGQITIVGDNAVGSGGTHTVEFSPDLNSPVAVNLVMKDRQQLQSHILGLCYYDTKNDKSVLLASLKDSDGELLSSHQVIYRDAFDDVDADVIYTYTAYSIEQNIILREQLPSPTQLGLDPENTYLSVMTEFIQPPEPLRVPTSIDLTAFNRSKNIKGLSRLSDETIQFKTMQIVQGKAFSSGDDTTAIPVGKNWLEVNGRNFLVESTPYSLIETLLSALPAQTAQVHSQTPKSFQAMLLSIPTPSLAKKSSRIQLAKTSVNKPGVVLDYLMVSTPLLNINFGGYDTDKVGPAAIGDTTNDFWNGCGGRTPSTTIYDLKWADGNRSGISTTVLNAPGVWGNTTGDGMYDVFIYPWNGGSVTNTLFNVPPGTYDFYLYGHSQLAQDNTAFQIIIGGVSTPVKLTQDSTYAATSTNWTEGVQYVSFTNISISSGQTVTIIAAPGDGTAILNGLQMVSDVTGSPVILSQPADESVPVGANTFFAVTASGTTPMSYQWQLNGVNIPGATSAVLSLNNVQLTDNGGTYTVIVSNSLGSVTSSAAVLMVTSAYSALMNIDFKGGETQSEAGFAATGLTTNDYWNEFASPGGNAGAMTMTNLAWSDGITPPLSSISVTVSNAPGIWSNSTGDFMYDVFIYPFNGGNIYVTLTNLPDNTYGFYLYGHSQLAQDNTKFQITVGANTTAIKPTQDSTFAASSSNWVENVQYVVFPNIVVTNGQPVQISCAPGDGTAILNGMQILLPMPSSTTDRDGNGLPDDWEITNFGHIGVNPNADPDGDGWTNYQEYRNGTNPNLPDPPFQVFINRPKNTSTLP